MIGDRIDVNIAECVAVVIGQLKALGAEPFIFPAMVENAAEETSLVEIVPAERVLQREPELLAMSKELAPKTFDEAGILAPMPTHGVRGDE